MGFFVNEALLILGSDVSNHSIDSKFMQQNFFFASCTQSMLSTQ